MGSPFEKGKPRVWREEDGPGRMPKSPGAYRFIREDKRAIDYIGITGNLYQRLSSHRCTNKQYDPTVHRVEYQTVDASSTTWAELCAWEAMKIGVHRPPLNKTKGGNGRVPKVFLESIGVEVEVGPSESIEDALEKKGLLHRLMELFRR